jgi:hypothetical protein
MTRPRAILLGAVLLAGATAAAVGIRRALVLHHHGSLATSCINHAMMGQAGLRNRQYGGGDKSARLPKSTEYDDFLAWTGTLEDGYRDGLVCPARKDGGPATGYVFVGGGLPLRGPPRMLVAFCADENHAPEPDFQTAMTLDECRTWPRAEVAELIERALAAAADGSMPYSPEAVALLKSELAKRRRPR